MSEEKKLTEEQVNDVCRDVYPTFEEVRVGDQSIEIETKPITLICPNANMAMGPPIEYPKRVPLSIQETTYHAERVKVLHPQFEQVWKLFHSVTSNPTPPEELGEISADRIRTMGAGAVHLMGLIDLSLKFQDQGVPVVWRYPESALHPGWQVALGDVLIFLMKRGEEVVKLKRSKHG